MKISIDKKFITVGLFEELKAKLPEIRKNKAMFEDMQTCISGIRDLGKWEAYSCKAEIREIEIFGTFTATIRVKAILSGLATKGGDAMDYIATANIYGEFTDDYTYFKWSETAPDGSPAKSAYSVQVYIADL